METMHYVGLDIHKKIIAFCIKTLSGTIVDQGTIPATKRSLTKWMKALDTPWTVAMEATLFTGWIYDFIKLHAFKICVAHPEMLKATTAAKKKNDKADAKKIADLLRVNMIPECYMIPYELRELRKILRYRNHVVRTAVKEKNKKIEPMTKPLTPSFMQIAPHRDPGSQGTPPYHQRPLPNLQHGRWRLWMPQGHRPDNYMASDPLYRRNNGNP